MKKLLLTMAAVSALSIGAPAAAQYGDAGVQARLQQLQVRLDAGIRSGAIPRGEAMRLRDQLRALTRLDWQYRRGGYSRAELAELERRIQLVRRQLRETGRYAGSRYDRNRDGYDDRYDRNRDGDDDRFDRDDDGDDDRFDRNDDDRDDRFDRNRDGDDDRFDRDNDGDDDRFDRDDDDRDDRFERLDRNSDGWDDRDVDRDGRWDDDVSEGRLRAGAGAGAMLSIGQRATADLGPVPMGLRSQYRDRTDVYYRSDGRAVYAISTRTGAVIAVHPLPAD